MYSCKFIHTPEFRHTFCGSYYVKVSIIAMLGAFATVRKRVSDPFFAIAIMYTVLEPGKLYGTTIASVYL